MDGDRIPSRDAPTPSRRLASSPRRRRRPRRADAGRILSTSLRVYRRNLAPFSLLAGLVFLPVLILDWSVVGRVFEGPGAPEHPLRSVLAMMLPHVLTGALAYGVFQELLGRRAPFLSCVGRGLVRLARVLGVAVLMSVALAFSLVLPMAILGAFDVMLMLLGGVVGLAIVILLTVMWYVAVPAAVVEPRTGPVRALGRSAALTAGSRAQLFLVVLLLGFVAWATGFAIEKALVETAKSEGAMRIALAVRYAAVALVGALQAVAAAVAYHDLRVAKEGIDVSDLVRVFE
jgi:hypothetical protein